jgi:hypothetical protein
MIRTIDTAILKRAEMVGEEGFAIADIVGFQARQVDSAARRLMKSGQLHRGKSGHRTMRLFARAEWAESFSANYVTACSRRASKPVNAPSGPGVWSYGKRCPWPAGTEAVYPTDAHGNPLYKHTVVPGFTPDRIRALDLPIRTNTYSEN